MDELRNKLRGPDAPFDPYAKALKEQEYNAKRPSRMEAQHASTLGSTIPQQRLRLRAHGSAATQSIASGAAQNVIVDINTVTTTFPAPHEFDTSDGTNVAGLLNTNGLLIPSTGKTTGAWLIMGQVTWEASGAGYRELNIIANVAANILAQHRGLGQNDLQGQQIFTIVNDPPAGTFYKLMVNQTSGGALNLDKRTDRTFLTAVHLW